MNAADHRHEAEQALDASIDHRQRWARLEPGTDEANAEYDAAMWEMGRAKVHALLSLSGPPATGLRPPSPAAAAPRPGPPARARR